MIEVRDVHKSFTLHQQGSTVIPVLAGGSLTVGRNECVALTGVSGSGKSTLMRMIYGNYLTQSGSIRIDGVEVVGAEPRAVLELRRDTIGYVSQFLRVVPRVSSIDVVAEPLLANGEDADTARSKACEALARLNIPEALWGLSPLTFSGGEQQRVNIARGFVYRYPALLLDEPTASLDAANRDIVLEMIEEAREAGAAILGIFHDVEARERVCTREVDVSAFTPVVA